jgi:molybdopterin converting factor small subunit
MTILRIAKAMLDDWQKDTCVGKYLKTIFDNRIDKENEKRNKEGRPGQYRYASGYAGQFQAHYKGINKKRAIMGMHGYGGQHIVIVKIKLELFGASRDFSDKDHLDIEVQDKASVDDLRNEIIKYIDKNFSGNENFIKVVKSSAFCSENNEIISDNYKITKDQKIGIIPPIGGG